MAKAAFISVIHRLVSAQAPSGLADQGLLERFIAHQDEAAFAVLVERHGAMVLAVARNVLHHLQDAEDVFQATFLLLARQAGSVRKQGSLGSWLHGVAYRLALKARKAAAARHRLESRAPERVLGASPDDLSWRELNEILHEELESLPDKYRAPLVLCYLEGLTQDQAAEHLGLAKGTLKGRLERARLILRGRLIRRGLAPAVVLLVETCRPASAALAAPLLSTTAGTAAAFAAGKAVAVPPQVIHLTEGVLPTMIATKLRLVGALFLAISLGAAATAVVASRGTPDGPPATEKESPVSTHGTEAATVGGGADKPRERPPVRQPDLTGRVVAVGTDGKSFTVKGVARERLEESVKVEVTIGEKTAITYNGVTTGGTKPTKGYAVAVWMDDAVKGLAARVGFGGFSGGKRWADLTGTVAEVDPDGKGISVKVAAEGGMESKKVRVRFNARTVLAFFDVTRARIEKNLTAWVWYDDARVSGNRIAGQVHFYGSASRKNRRPDLSGKLLAADDLTLTIEQPAARPGGEPKKVVLKLGARSLFVYHNVGLGGAKPSAGQQAQVWLERGSKDTAAEVALSGVVPERWATLRGKVVGVSRDGATFTLEQPPAVRGGKPRQVEVKLTGQTRISYSNIGPDGAKPTAGYSAVVRLLDGSKTTAAWATFERRGDRGR
jgi:RNA polymerase sigma factor (sigma-70 family)